MSTQFGGEPAVAQNALPVAVNISSSTNATPVVIATATDHGLKVGDYFVCEGADEPAINAVPLMAGAVTATTVVALLAPAGTNTVGTLAGAANGTLRATGFGVTYAIPSDTTDGMTAASVNVAFEALGDRTSFLMRLSYFSWELAFNMWFSNAQLIGGGGASSIPANAGAGLIDVLPHGAFVQTVKVLLTPAVHASLPATMPKLTLYVFSLTGSIVSSANVSDTSPNVGVYDTPHDITLTLSAPIFIDRSTFTYTINLDGEAGANSDTLTIGPARVLLS